MKPITGAVLALMLAAMPALAQQPATQFMRGTIDSVEGNQLTMTTREGEKVTVTLADELTVAYNTQKTVADLEPGVQLGVTSVEGEDGKPRALEAHIMDQTPGVHMPWDLEPDSMMTNGEITEVAEEGGDRVITIHYKTADAEGDYEIVVPADTPVVHLQPAGDRSLLVPGAYVFLVARQGENGTWTTGYINAEKDGVKPPL